MLREKTFVIVSLLHVRFCDISDAMGEDLNPIWLVERWVGNRSYQNMLIFVPGSTYRIFFAQNAAGKHRLDAFPTSSMYLWYIRSIERRFKPDLTCSAVGVKSVASRYIVSQYVDFRPPDPHFDLSSPKMLRENIVSMLFLLDLCIYDVVEALRED